MSEQKNDPHPPHLAAAVVTTSGRWPDTGFQNVSEHEPVKNFLDQAARHLHIASTQGWIATVGNKTLNPDQTFATNGFTTGDILVDYGPRQGGGGRA